MSYYSIIKRRSNNNNDDNDSTNGAATAANRNVRTTGRTTSNGTASSVRHPQQLHMICFCCCCSLAVFVYNNYWTQYRNNHTNSSLIRGGHSTTTTAVGGPTPFDTVIMSHAYSTNDNHHPNDPTTRTTNKHQPQVVHSIYDVSDHHDSQHYHTNTSATISSITTAICYKTLFGTSMDIGLILQWIAYHHLLGFDHFFFFYRDEVMVLPNWELLISNPIVTMIAWNDIGTRDSYYDQASGTEVECLTKHAVMYDWVYIADIDEYLYLGPKNRNELVLREQQPASSNIQDENGLIETPFSTMSSDRNDLLTVKELVHIYHNMTYLSFGKRMYSLDHRIDVVADDMIIDDIDDMTVTNYQITTVIPIDDNNNDGTTTATTTLRPDSTFIVSKYPYYMDKYFCHHRGHRRGDVICPKWRGRAKVMVRPLYHTFIDVHGNYAPDELQPNERYGIIHFHPDLYHIKEWPNLYSPHNITIHSPPPPSPPLGLETSGNRAKQKFDNSNNNDSDNANSDYYIDNYYNFTITKEEEVHIHNIHTGYLPFIVNDDNSRSDELFLVKLDTSIQQYFHNVLNLATNQYGHPIRIQQ